MQTWPQGAWFGLTRRRLMRGFLFGLPTLLVTAALLFGAMLLYVHYRASQARGLLEQVRELRIGEPLPSHVQALTRRHAWEPHLTEPGPRREDDSLFMLVDTFGFGKPVGGHQTRDSAWLASAAWQLLDKETLNYFGIRFWETGAWIELEHGRVQSVHAAVFVEGPNHTWAHSGWNHGPTIPDHVWEVSEIADCQVPRLVTMGNFLHWGIEGGHRIQAWTTKEATDKERRVASSINLDCLTRFGGCSLRELAPLLLRHDNPDECR